MTSGNRTSFCKLALSVLAACALLSATGAAKAAIITETYDFTVSGVPTSPVDPWIGSFTITFDPTALGRLGPFSVPFSSNLPATFNPFVFTQSDFEIIFGNNCQAGTCSGGPNQAFVVFFVDGSGNPIDASAVGAVNESIGESTSVTLASTPLPAALPLFATGLGALGLFGWRRKRKPHAVA